MENNQQKFRVTTLQILKELKINAAPEIALLEFGKSC